MAGVAEKGKDGLMRIAFEEATQLHGHLVTISSLRLYQGQILIRSESKSGDNLFEIALVSENTRQVAVCLYKSIFADFGKLPDIVEQ